MNQEQKKYMLRYGREPVVVKGTGKIFDTSKNDKPFNYFLDDIAKCHQNKLKIAIVHGGGTEINDKLIENGILPIFAKDGSRVTFSQTLPYVIESMAEVNQTIVEGLHSRGINARSVSGKDIFHAAVKDFENLGYVGELTGFKSLSLDKTIVPVVNPISCDKSGQTLNVNADDAATELAVAKKARLIMMSDSAVMNNGVLIPEINIAGAELKKLIADGVIKEGMLKKISECSDAIERGMKPMSIIDGTRRNALWNELATDAGSGTMIYKEELSV